MIYKIIRCCVGSLAKYCRKYKNNDTKLSGAVHKNGQQQELQERLMIDFLRPAFTLDLGIIRSSIVALFKSILNGRSYALYSSKTRKYNGYKTKQKQTCTHMFTC